MKKTVLLLTGLVFFLVETQAQSVTDFDGNIYDTVKIGSQVWMKQNLRVTHYNNGIPIPNITGNGDWATLSTGARCYYNNDSAAYDAIYGALYNWYAVNDANNICPPGWHISTNDEWQAAEEYLGGASIAGGKMKEAGTLHWNSPNTGATNSSGFTGLPGGMRDPANNNFRAINENGLWWTATSYNSTLVWSTYLWYLFAGVDHNPVSKKYGLSIRCVKDLGTGTNENTGIEKIKIYPNPATTKIQIEFTDKQYLYMQIYNSTGICLLQDKLSKPLNEIDISSLPTGVYVIKLSCPEWNLQKKLIKK